VDERRVVEVLLAELVAGIDGPPRSSALTPDPVRAAEIVAALGPVALAPGRRATWLVANGRRVDATVVAGDREWRLASSIDEDGVHSATVLERPSAFVGRSGGRAVIVNGPSSAGKSATMAAVVERASTPWVAFDELSFGNVGLRFLVWPEMSPTLRPGFVAGIVALAAAGNQVITTGGRPGTFAPLRDAVPTLVVGLDCPMDVRVARQAARTDRWGGLTESSDDAHAGWVYDVRFDTSALSAEAIADRVIELA
jgi:chloramphenicol 3-O-phosphotransferase